ncbi:MAG TPA: CBS domain-containing protein [Vicinamibacterales bacterium]|jgi:CBS domain-containing protein
MKVKDLMSTDVRTCTPETTVAEGARLMREADCGMLPVVDGGELVGVVTDRDICIALSTQDARASHLRVGAIARTNVATCAPEDDIKAALTSMTQARVRRLPVVGFGRAVMGVLSMSDILRAVEPEGGTLEDRVIETLQAICGHHRAPSHIIAA